MNSILDLCRELVAKKKHRLTFLEKIKFPVSPLEIYQAFNMWNPEDGKTMLMIQHERNFESYVGLIRGEDIPKLKVTRNGDKVIITSCEDNISAECPLTLISFVNSEIYIEKIIEGDE